MEGSPEYLGQPRQGPAAEEVEPQGASWSRDSGNVSQSHSSASGPWEEEGPELGAPGRDLPLLRRAAAGYAACLLPGAGARPEVEALDASLEDLLTRVDEFVGMLDMLRGDSSHVVGEGVPRIHAKAAEMRRVYGRIDRLEAFVGMIGAGVARLEEQVARAEAELGAFPSTFRRLLHSISAPSFLSRAPPGGRQRAGHEPPALFRTEDHFPCCSERERPLEEEPRPPGESRHQLPHVNQPPEAPDYVGQREPKSPPAEPLCSCSSPPAFLELTQLPEACERNAPTWRAPLHWQRSFGTSLLNSCCKSKVHQNANPQRHRNLGFRIRKGSGTQRSPPPGSPPDTQGHVTRGRHLAELATTAPQ
ncbi:Biogenesis of lysosome-related organelles complex 1 subunit 4 [Manis javanica]|nr:Biogenesis of lysosome-related organelles complex 1 subunit 4 [Manis javanica]